MDITLKRDCTDVDWKKVCDILKAAGMAFHDPDTLERAFQNSAVTVFLYRHGQLIGFGRAISDGAYQAALYDVAVYPDFQRRGLGNKIVEELLARFPGYNVILYASPGKEGFYVRHGFRKMKTGMARFVNAQRMSERGFIK